MEGAVFNFISQHCGEKCISPQIARLQGNRSQANTSWCHLLPMERTLYWRGWSKSVAMGKVQWGLLKRSYSVRKTKKRVAATDGEACAILGLSTGAELPQRERAEWLLGPLPQCPAEPAFWTKSQNNEFFHITRQHQVVRWERGFSPDPFPDFLRKGYLKTWFSFCRLPASGFCRNSSLKVPVCIQEGPEGGEALVPPTSGAADKDSHCYSSFSLNGRLHRKLVWWLTTWMRHS